MRIGNQYMLELIEIEIKKLVEKANEICSEYDEFDNCADCPLQGIVYRFDNEYLDICDVVDKLNRALREE